MTWLNDAACAGKTDLFFPGQGNHPYTEAAALCARCPVIDDCRADMEATELELPMVHGFRAGMDPEHRRERMRARLGGKSGARRVLARQVLAWSNEGKMTHEIASLLGCSKRNVARLRNDAEAGLATASTAA